MITSVKVKLCKQTADQTNMNTFRVSKLIKQNIDLKKLAKIFINKLQDCVNRGSG